jgi:hypothetical protein
MDIKVELDITRTTVKKLLSEKQKWSKYGRDLRFQIVVLKKKMLALNTSFIEYKMKCKERMNELKKEIRAQKKVLDMFMLDDDDFIVDPVTGVIDMTQSQPQPITPQKAKRNKIVRKGAKKSFIKKLKF